MNSKKTIVFDFGGVLIDWNPRYLYRKLIEREEEMEWFLENICTSEWNANFDEGHPFEEGVKQLAQKYPEHEELIIAYYQRWPEMLAGEITGTVQILKDIKSANYPVFGLTNWSGETFPIAFERFEFLKLLDGILVSGDEKLVKPDPQIFELLCSRFGIEPEKSIFIDDNRENIEAARKIGFDALHFTAPGRLRENLEMRGIL